MADRNDSGTRVEILLIEDNPGDVRLTKLALKGGKILNNINVVMDGAEAMDYLLRKGKYSEATRPDLIILDLNLPKKDGRQVLKEIKDNDSLRRIPIVVLTTSRDEQDVLKSYNLHANAYITKPLDLDQFIDVVRSIETFWVSVVRLPPK
ncbi:MAG: response regulator [Methanomassiliicoccales archaeon]|nr:response regulator [Methanomassiliicoccales archaeon]